MRLLWGAGKEIMGGGLNLASLLPIFLLLIGLFPRSALSGDSPMRLELVHRHGLRTFRPRTRFQQMMELARSDARRSKMVSEMLERRRRRQGRRAWEVPANASSFAMPMSSGAYSGTGQYFVRFRVGTPAQKFLLVADTGSDLTWMNCHYRCPACRSGRRRVFRADYSRSFRPINCSSYICKNELPFSLSACPSPVSYCDYDYGYEDGSRAEGFFALEHTTVRLPATGEKAKFKNVVIGCTSSAEGTSFHEADGVLGLGYSQHSFAAQATSTLGGKFFYCLVDHLSYKNVTSFLTFGRDLPTSYALMSYTPLTLREPVDPFYVVEIAAISVGDQQLNIPPAVWALTNGGGVILDTGTSLTILVEPAYTAVMAALSEPLQIFPRVDMQPFEFCFNVTEGFDEAAMARLAVHFAGGALFEPPVKSYVVDVSDGVKCLGFLSTPAPGVSTIGNILQQNYLWEFDVVNLRLGFQPSTCSY